MLPWLLLTTVCPQNVTFGKPPRNRLAAFATSPTRVHFSHYHTWKRAHHHGKSLTRASQRMMTALPHLNMHIIFPDLDIAASSPKVGLCSPTNLLKSYLIRSHKTGVSWVVFVRVFISTHAQSFAFGLTECTLLLQVFLLFIKTILKSSPIQQSASDSLSLVLPATSIISVSTSLSKSLLKRWKET